MRVAGGWRARLSLIRLLPASPRQQPWARRFRCPSAARPRSSLGLQAAAAGTSARCSACGVTLGLHLCSIRPGEPQLLCAESIEPACLLGLARPALVTDCSIEVVCTRCCPRASCLTLRGVCSGTVMGFPLQNRPHWQHLQQQAAQMPFFSPRRGERRSSSRG